MSRPPTDNSEPVGHMIRAARKRLGLTIDELAERIGVEQPTMQRYEAGKRNVTVARLVEIAAALNCTPADLVPGGNGLTVDEDKILRRLRQASPADRRLIYATIAGLAAFAEGEEDWEEGA